VTRRQRPAHGARECAVGALEAEEDRPARAAAVHHPDVLAIGGDAAGLADLVRLAAADVPRCAGVPLEIGRVGGEVGLEDIGGIEQRAARVEAAQAADLAVLEEQRALAARVRGDVEKQLIVGGADLRHRLAVGIEPGEASPDVGLDEAAAGGLAEEQHAVGQGVDRPHRLAGDLDAHGAGAGVGGGVGGRRGIGDAAIRGRLDGRGGAAGGEERREEREA
jgi:hypothetical protein